MNIFGQLNLVIVDKKIHHPIGRQVKFIKLHVWKVSVSGNSCSTAVEHRPLDPEVVGLKPDVNVDILHENLNWSCFAECTGCF